MTQKKKKNLLSPPSAEVEVAPGLVYNLPPANLCQFEVFMEAAGGLKIEDAAPQVASTIEMIRSQGDDDGAKALMSKLPDLIVALKPIFQSQMVPVLRQCTTTLLDTEGFTAFLIENGLIEGDPDVELDRDGVFIGCSATRKWIKTNITLVAATKVITAAVMVNDLGQSVGNVLGLFMGRPKEQGQD